MKPTTVYRLFDTAGTLLYVGIAGNPGRRFEQHAGDKPWWGSVANLTLEHHLTREAATIAERDAIIAEKPLYNVMHNRGDHRVAAVPPAADRSGIYTFENRRYGGEWTSRLELYPELDCSSCVDDSPDSDGQAQLDYYVEYLQRREKPWLDNDAVPIHWVVLSRDDDRPGIFERAPFQFCHYPQFSLDEDFLSFFTWPRDDHHEPLDWFTLPVRYSRFPEFGDALGWTPSPLQPFAPLRSIMQSKRGVYPQRVPAAWERKR